MIFDREVKVNVPMLICVNEDMFEEACDNWYFSRWYDSLSLYEKKLMASDREDHSASHTGGQILKFAGRAALALATGLVTWGSDVENRVAKEFDPDEYNSLFNLMYEIGMTYSDLKARSNYPKLIERA